MACQSHCTSLLWSPAGPAELPAELPACKAVCEEPSLLKPLHVMAECGQLQGRMCKLLLYPGEDHEVPRGVQLVPWDPPTRKLVRSEPAFELPPDFVPLNLDAYSKRFGHLLPQPHLQRLRALQTELSAGSTGS